MKHSVEFSFTIADGQQKYWERPLNSFDEKNPWTSNTRPISVETTAYALLTYMQRNLVGKWRIQH